MLESALIKTFTFFNIHKSECMPLLLLIGDGLTRAQMFLSRAGKEVRDHHNLGEL